MGRTLAVANQKGGVAKTTTVAGLGAVLADAGLRVLLVDLDPQACLTFSLGTEPEERDADVTQVVLGGLAAPEAVRHVPVPRRRGRSAASEPVLDLLPATLDLAGAEESLQPLPRREFRLREALAGVLASSYDVVVVDCSPSLGLLTVNALAAADEVVVPVQPEILAHRGVGQLLDTVDDVRHLLNPRLRVRGLLPTMVDTRTAHTRAVLADLAGRYGEPVLEPWIPRSVRFPEASALGVPLPWASPASSGAGAYRQVGARLLQSWRAEDAAA
ncbi:MAG: ParA family protein [Kineosporiaceae bacterium]